MGTAQVAPTPYQHWTERRHIYVYTKLLRICSHLIRAILGMRPDRIGADGHNCKALWLVVLCKSHDPLCIRKGEM